MTRHADFISDFATCGFPASPPQSPPAPTASPTVTVPTPYPTPSPVSSAGAPTTGSPTTMAPTDGYTALTEAEKAAYGKVTVEFTLNGDLTDYSDAFKDALDAQVAYDCNVHPDYVTTTFAAGSTVVTIEIQATGTGGSGTSVSFIEAAITANFGSDGSLLAAYIQAATAGVAGCPVAGCTVTVTGYSATTTAAVPTSSSSDDGILFGQGIAVVAGAAGGIGLVLILLIGGLVWHSRRKSGKVAPGGGPDTSTTSGSPTAWGEK